MELGEIGAPTSSDIAEDAEAYSTQTIECEYETSSASFRSDLPAAGFGLTSEGWRMHTSAVVQIFTRLMHVRCNENFEDDFVEQK